jgi:hypothetical protein
MTQDEIRKLLGGYATNALTAEERQALFEATLEDQELFNALQNEDTLKELLDDPALRDQVRRALVNPTAPIHRPGFPWRRWVFGVAMPAVAAVILIVVMNRPKASEPAAQPVQMARVEPKQMAPAPVTAPLAKKQSTSGRKQLARAIPAPPPVAAPATAAPVQLESAQRAAVPAAANSSAAAIRPVIPEAIRQQLTAAVAANAPLYQGPLVRYSLVRGSSDGNMVRVDVSTSVGGYLALYRVDASGNSTRVYPANEVAAQVPPNLAMQIPIDRVKVAPGERLRLVLIPSTPPGVMGALGGVAARDAITATKPSAAEPGTPPAPLVVDIPVVP